MNKKYPKKLMEQKWQKRLLTISIFSLILIPVFTVILLRGPDIMFIIFMIVIGAVAIIAIVFFSPLAVRAWKWEFGNRPNQYEEVEIIEKRTFLSPLTPKTYNHIVVFKFPDGSIKDFGVPKEELYNSIHEGDTGNLTYIEYENIEEHVEKKELHYTRRTVINFEKTLT